MKTFEAHERTDPVARMVTDLTAEEMTDWLIEHHGLNESSRQTVESNLREQFRWHRLQGRLDRDDTAKTVAELLSMYRPPETLESPNRKKEG